MTLPAQTAVDPATAALGVLTQLGDVWLVTLLALLAYWLGPRTPVVGPGLARGRAATVLALVVLAIVCSVALKAWFAVPRPGGGLVAPTVPDATVESVLAWLAGADGYGFPSGHAVLSTAGWGGFAWAVRRGTVRERVAVAAAVISVVGACRVALGLHTPLQVLAGVALGAVALAVAIGIGRPAIVAGLGALAGAGGVALAGPVPELLLAGGLAAGLAVVWAVRTPHSAPAPTRRSARVAVALGALLALPALAALATLEPGPPVHAGAAVATGVVVAAVPTLADRLVGRVGAE